MRYAITFILLAFPAIVRGDTYTIAADCSGLSNCTVYVGTASIQSVFAAAQCGDTIRFQSGRDYVLTTGSYPTLDGKACSAANPITITNTMEEWMPLPGHWPSQSYLPLYPRLSQNGGGSGSVVMALGERGTGVKGVVMRGIALVSKSDGVSPILHIAPNWVYYDPNVDFHNVGDPTKMPDEITIDRNIIMHDYTVEGGSYAGINWNGVNGTIKDNVFLHLHIDNNTASACMTEDWAHYTGSMLFRHNYCADGPGEGVIFGQGNSMYYHSYQNNHIFEHNHIYKSLQYVSGHPWNTGVYSSFKNCFETKNSKNYIIRYNTCENSWENRNGSQWYGVTITPRINVSHKAGTVTLSAGARGENSRVMISGITFYTCCSANPPMLSTDLWIGLPKNQLAGANCGGYGANNCEWHKIIAVDNTAQWADVDAPYTQTIATSGMGWNIANGEASGDNGQIYGNFFKNAGSMMQLIREGDEMGAGNRNMNTSAANIAFFDNINYIYENKYMPTNWGWTHNGKGAKDWFIHHNTTVRRKSASQYNNGDFGSSGAGGDMEGLKVIANIIPGNGSNDYSCNISPGGAQPNINGMKICTADSNLNWWAYNIYEARTSTTGLNDTSTNRVFRNNATTGAGNQIAFLNPTKHLFAVDASSPWAHTGRNGETAGADPERVAMIRNLNVSATDQTALVSWEVTEPIYGWDAQLECSPDVNLWSEKNYYTPINDLNPAYFKQADEGVRNPRYTQGSHGRYRWWQIGDLGSATGDDGQSHTLSLTPNTAYYCRLSVAGAVERFSFKTRASAPADQSSIAVQAKSNAGTKVRIRSGSQAGSLTAGTPVACSSGCSVTASVTAGRQVVFYIDELDDSDKVVASGSVPTVLLVGGRAGAELPPPGSAQ